MKTQVQEMRDDLMRLFPLRFNTTPETVRRKKQEKLAKKKKGGKKGC